MIPVGPIEGVIIEFFSAFFLISESTTEGSAITNVQCSRVSATRLRGARIQLLGSHPSRMASKECT